MWDHAFLEKALMNCEGSVARSDPLSLVVSWHGEHKAFFFFVFSVGPLFKLNVNLLEGNLNLHHVVEMFLEFPCINV